MTQPTQNPPRGWFDSLMQSASSLEASERLTRWVLFAIVVMGVALRLYQFDGTILDHHYLRQVDTAALARNFAQEGMDIFHPRVDWRGASNGYVESEFQAYTYMIAALYRMFGEHVELARGLNLIFFAAAAVVLYDFARRLFDRPAALLSVFFFSAMPLTIFAAHSVQPDTLMLLAALSTVYFFWRWCEEGKLWLLAASAVALCIAMLIKPLNIYLGAPLLFLCFQRFGWALFLKPQLWAFGIAALGPAVLWYVHAYSLWVEHGNTLYRAYSQLDFKWLSERAYPYPLISLSYPSYASDLVWRLFFLVTTPGGVIALFAGVLAIDKKTRFFAAWLGGFALTMLVFVAQHRGHDYYQLPLTIVIAMLMGAGVMRLWRMDRPPRRLAAASMAAFSLLGAIWFWRYRHEAEIYNAESVFWTVLFVGGSLLLAAFALGLQRRALVMAGLAMTIVYGPWQAAQMTRMFPSNAGRPAFGERLEALTLPNDQVVIGRHWNRPDWYQHRSADGDLLGYDPVDLYLSNRKGWSLFQDHLNTSYIESLRLQGADVFASYCCSGLNERWILDDRPALRESLACAYTPLDVNERWVIYRLDTPRTRPDGTSCLEAASVASPRP